MPKCAIGATLSLEYTVGLLVVSKQVFIENLSGRLM
jgi:hypothetical protein